MTSDAAVAHAASPRTAVPARLREREPARWMLVAAAFVLPLYPKVGVLAVAGTYVPVRIDDALIAALAATWIGGLLKQRRRPASPPAAAPAAIWLACSLCALAVGSFVLGTVGLERSLLYWAKPLEYLLLAWIAYDLELRRRILRSLLIVAAAAAAAVVGYGVLQRAGIAGAAPTYNGYAVWGVVTSTVADPHELASYLGICMLVAAACFPVLRGRGRLALAALLVAAAAAMTGTGARSEFLALGAGLVALAVGRRRRPVALLTIAALALSLWLPSHAPQGPATGGRPGRGSAASSATAQRLVSQGGTLSIRLERKWPALWRASGRDPLLGLGPSAAGEAADGYYLRALVETGVVGLAAFLALIASVAAALIRVARSAPVDLVSSLAIGLLVSVCFVALVGILIDTWVASRPMELLWPLVGAALGAGNRRLTAHRGGRLAAT